jgi:ABC-type antimicrobial peptide transport system permease subunit
LVIRAQGDPLELAPTLRATALAVDPGLEIHDPITLDAVVRSDLEFYDFWITLVVSVSVIALVLSLAGIYSAMSFAVSRRTREIGIRAALGARRGEIVLAIFRRPLLQLAAGIAVGALLTIGLMNASDGSLTFREWSATVTYVVFITAITTLACIVPTRRALAVEPTAALRTE